MRCGCLCEHLVRIAILFVFSRMEGVLCSNFWCCVVCNECADVRHMTYFPHLIRTQTILAPILANAWDLFVSDAALQTQTQCSICYNPNTTSRICCDECNDVATEMKRQGADPSEPISLADISILYFLFLFKHKVDVVKELVPLVCYNSTCQIQMQRVTVYFSCQHCHSVLFCSKECMNAAHGNVECHWFLQHWL